MRTVISDLLLDIASGKNGYSISKPWRFTEFSLVAVVPILRRTRQTRNYRLLSEVQDLVKIKDTGNISKVELINRDEYPVLLKAGEVLAGATQSRSLARSEILMPGEKVEADCVCVYSTKGIREGQDMIPDAYCPTEVRKAIYGGYYTRTGDLSPAYHYSPDVQRDTWESVNCCAKGMSASVDNIVNYMASAGEPVMDMSQTFHTPQQDLAGRITESQDKFKEILKKVPKVRTQVGMCLLTMTGLDLMESFNHPGSWEAIRKAILGSESSKISDVSDRDGLFEFREDRAKDIILELLGTEFEDKATVEKETTATYILDSKKFTGEVVTLYGAPIHCAFVRKAS